MNLEVLKKNSTTPPLSEIHPQPKTRTDVKKDHLIALIDQILLKKPLLEFEKTPAKLSLISAKKNFSRRLYTNYGNTIVEVTSFQKYNAQIKKEKKSIETALFLLDYGMTIPSMTKEIEKALMEAMIWIMTGRGDLNNPYKSADVSNYLKKLESWGFDFSQKDRFGQSLLDIAVEFEDWKNAEKLFKLGSKLNKNKFFTLPKGKIEKLEKPLASLFTKLETFNLLSKTYVKDLHHLASWTVRINKLESLKLLFDSGINCNLPSFAGLTPMANAILYKRQSFIDFLKTKNQDEREGQEILNKKYLAHVWGIKGHSPVILKNGQTISVGLECIVHEYPIERLAHSIPKFFSKNKSSFNASKRKILQNVLKDASLFDRSAVAAVKEIKGGKPYVMISGFKQHAVSYTFCSDLFMIGNRGLRGDNRSAGIQIYACPKEKVTIEFIEFLQKRNYTPKEFEKSLMSFNLKHLSSINLKKQKVRNCAWGSSKCAFYALAYGLSKETDPKKRLEDAKKLYKQFTLYARMESLVNYTPSEEDGLWETIGEKLPKKFVLFAHQKGLKVPALLSKPPINFQEFTLQLAALKKLTFPSNLSRFFSLVDCRSIPEGKLPPQKT